MSELPPKGLERLARRLIGSDSFADAILGDLAEEYVVVCARRSRGVAERWYVTQALRIGLRRRVARFRSRGLRRFTFSTMGDRTMWDITRDVRRGLRGMIKERAFTLIMAITLALGIGAVSSVFSVVDALVLRPFPVPDIERLVAVYGTVPSRGQDRGGVAPANFLDWSEQMESAELFAFDWWDVNITGGDVPERLQGSFVTPGFLDALGVRAAEGRTLAPDAARENERPRTVVLSYQLWSQRFGSDSSIVGSSVLLDGDRYEVVGVAEQGFEYPYGTQVWAPLWFDAETAANRELPYLEILGRLAEGSSVEDARAELGLIAKRLEDQYPEVNQGRGVNVLALSRAVVDIGAPAFLVVWQAATVFVLLIACVNVANLLLARANERQKEMTLQLALGASRLRLLRQLLVENVLLALLGALLALPLAWVGTGLLRDSLPAHIQRFVVGWDRIGLHSEILAFTAGVSFLTALVFGLLPALKASRRDLTSTMKEGGRSGTGSRARTRGRDLLVAGEVALALTLLVASGLTIQGIVRMLNEPQGYELDNIIGMRIALPESKYEAEEHGVRFFRDLLDDVRGLPEVTSAALINDLPSSGGNTSRVIDVEGRHIENVNDRPTAHFRVTTDGYFETMGIPLVRGRVLLPEDREDTMKVAVVSERFAGAFWPDEDAIGKRFRHEAESDAPFVTVIGIVGDVIHDWFLQSPQQTFYVPLAQEPRYNMALAARTTGTPEAVVPSIRSVVRHLDPDQPIYNVRSMRTRLSERLIGVRFAASLMAVFGAIALVLAAIGVYGLMAYSVSRRTHEIGLRVALGADRRDVLRLTLVSAIYTTLIGIAVGLVLSYGAGRVMASSLFGVIQLDAKTYLGLAVLLSVISLVAGLVPARRAMGIDPAEALRVE